MTVTGWIVLTLFGLATLVLSMYGLHLYALLLLFRRRQHGVRRGQQEVIERYLAEHQSDLPTVTTQIPLYNEREVARRVIHAVADMDYPADRHQIQVLDDSTDETREIVDQCVQQLAERGVDICVVRRAGREGYKAGALVHGLRSARGEYVAIFDADFVPPRGFLRRAIPLIDRHDDVACIQGRWGHLNERESWLTKAQALGIDGHFAIEQGARAWNGLLMNFNGTAGVWRKTAIDDPAVGGWSGDTLTEDLDLSYRAQLAGWKLDYSFDLVCPAELPGSAVAFKSQQRRWATGSIQTARKLLPAIWKSRLSAGQKIEATLHLTHYSVSLWMLILALIARPMLFLFASDLAGSRLFELGWCLILLSAAAPSLVYAYARYVVSGRWHGFRTIPSMMVLGCGVCANNALAVVRGLFYRGGEFVRTPKSGSTSSARKGNAYRVSPSDLWIVELLLGVYSLSAFVLYAVSLRSMFSLFLLMYGIGFLGIGWLSRPDDAGSTQVRRRPAAEGADGLVVCQAPDSNA